VRQLPGFNANGDDTQELFPGSIAVSPSVLGLKCKQVDETLDKISGNHFVSLPVTAAPEKSEWRCLSDKVRLFFEENPDV